MTIPTFGKGDIIIHVGMIDPLYREVASPLKNMRG